ncbi:hypothetical protein OJAV_G00182190, partial [Oryzias javanicus]
SFFTTNAFSKSTVEPTTKAVTTQTDVTSSTTAISPTEFVSTTHTTDSSSVITSFHTTITEIPTVTVIPTTVTVPTAATASTVVTTYPGSTTSGTSTATFQPTSITSAPTTYNITAVKTSNTAHPTTGFVSDPSTTTSDSTIFTSVSMTTTDVSTRFTSTTSKSTALTITSTTPPPVSTTAKAESTTTIPVTTKSDKCCECCLSYIPKDFTNGPSSTACVTLATSKQPSSSTTAVIPTATPTTSTLSPTITVTKATTVRKMTFRSPGEIFTNELLNSSSPDFVNRSALLKSTLEPIYKEAFTSFRSLTVISFRNGSIINSIDLVFESSSAPGNTEIVNVLVRTAPNIANFTIDLNSIVVDGTSRFTTPAPTTTAEKTTETPLTVTLPSSDTTATTISTSTKPFLSTTLPESTTSVTTTATSMKTTIPTTPVIPPQAFAVTATFLEPFVLALTIKTSPEFKALEDKAVGLYGIVFKSKFGNRFLRASVNVFREAASATRMSNTEAQMQVEFSRNGMAGTPIDVESVAQALIDGVSNASSQFNLTIDVNSIRVTELKNESTTAAPTPEVTETSTTLSTDAGTTTLNGTVTTTPTTTTITTTTPFLSTASPASTTPITTAATSMNTPVPTTAEVPPLIFTVIATFVEPFVEALTNKTSPEFKALEKKAVAVYESVYKNKFGDRFLRTFVILFSEAASTTRMSNTEAQMQVEFKRNGMAGTPIDVESVAQALIDGAANASNQFNLTIDANSIRV